MGEQIVPLDWKKNPLFILSGITAILLIITILLYILSNRTLPIIWVVACLVVGGITFFIYQNQCPKCKRVFCLEKVSDELLKKWEEPRQYNEKTIYYYSDGFTEKDVKNGATKTFIAQYEKHKEGFRCKKCNETSYKTRDIFLNRDGWERVTAPNKVTTSTAPPKVDFGLDSFEPTYYKAKGGERKSIPKEVKMQLWNNYFGKNNALGKCFVCKKEIHIQHFEAGHVTPASKNGSDKISNLRPLCFGCNRSMGNMNLYDYKNRYYN